MTDTVLTGDGDGAAAAAGDGAAAATPSFKDSIPEAYRGEACLADIHDMDAMCKTFVNAQRMIGAERLPMPKDDWTPEQYGEFYEKLGRPKEATDYIIPQVDLPDGLSVQDGQFDSALAKFHEIGLNDKQAQELLTYYMTDQAESYKNGMNSAEAKARECRDALMSEWGDRAEGNINRSMELVKQVGSSDLLDKINAAGLGRDADFIKFLEKASRPFSEDSAGGEGQTITLGGASRAQAEKTKLLADKSFLEKYRNRNDPGHKAAVEQIIGLQEIIAGQ
jgi:hypothetical protein